MGNNTAHSQAWVTPLQGWTLEGLANVLELTHPPNPMTHPVMTRLENKTPESYAVARSVYPAGLVLIAKNSEPQDLPSVLPLLNATGESVTVEIGGTEHPNGVVVLFKSS